MGSGEACAHLRRQVSVGISQSTSTPQTGTPKTRRRLQRLLTVECGFSFISYERTFVTFVSCAEAAHLRVLLFICRLSAVGVNGVFTGLV